MSQIIVKRYKKFMYSWGIIHPFDCQLYDRFATWLGEGCRGNKYILDYTLPYDSPIFLISKMC